MVGLKAGPGPRELQALCSPWLMNKGLGFAVLPGNVISAAAAQGAEPSGRRYEVPTWQK